MTQWIETDDGYVNLAHVVAIRRGKGGTSVLELTNGAAIATAMWNGLHDLLTATVIPAAPGQDAWMAHLPYSNTERPTEVYMKRLPVIGWRIPHKQDGHGGRVHPAPILPDGSKLDDSTLVAVILADGELLDTMTGQIFDSRAELEAYILNDAWEVWDRLHASKAEMSVERAVEEGQQAA